MGDKKREEKKVKKRFSMVLALAMVFSLVLSSVAMAAPEGAKISNELELEVTVKEGVEGATIGVNPDLALTSAVGLYDCFTVSTTPGDHAGKMVKVKLEATPATGFELEYVEQNPNHSDYGKYLLLPVDDNGVAWFGPSTGFPLAAVEDSMFRVTWNEAGTYTFTLRIMDGDNFTNELASETVTVNVAEGNAMALAHATAGAGEVASIKDHQELYDKIIELSPVAGPATYTVNEVGGEFDYVVVANLDNNVSHVDNVLFIFEVTKDNIAVGDFEITEISLRGNTEGINDTFEIVDGILKGYWGPPKGDLFKGLAATAFTVKFNTEGTYIVNTYAIQVKPAETADL
jgi:hypothetical protein